MSVWTKVRCVIETPALLSTSQLENIFGAQVVLPDPPKENSPEEKAVYDKALNEMLKVYDDMKVHPDKYLPCGSEGTLKMSGPVRRYGLNHYYIYGNLRDYMQPEKIADWFRFKFNKLLTYIRSFDPDDAYNTVSLVEADCYPISVDWSWGEMTDPALKKKRETDGRPF